MAQRGGDIGAFGLTSVGYTAGPEIARLYATGDRERLQRVLHRAALFAFAVAACVFVGYAIADQRLLRWVFGAGFERAYAPLLIYAGVQAINAFFGVNSTVLVMCGRERMVTFALFVSVTIQVLASPPLISAFGSSGAALSLALSFLIWNLIQLRAARRRAGRRHRRHRLQNAAQRGGRRRRCRNPASQPCRRGHGARAAVAGA